MHDPPSAGVSRRTIMDSFINQLLQMKLFLGRRRHTLFLLRFVLLDIRRKKINVIFYLPSIEVLFSKTLNEC